MPPNRRLSWTLPAVLIADVAHDQLARIEFAAVLRFFLGQFRSFAIRRHHIHHPLFHLVGVFVGGMVVPFVLCVRGTEKEASDQEGRGTQQVRDGHLGRVVPLFAAAKVGFRWE